MSFSQEVINWYTRNKRDLPWRNTTDPYVIWLSEIILQQTRVEQGMPYFYRFAEAFPTVAAFAGAREDEILKLWQGLGYYSRGRNMHHTAQVVMEEFGGSFPSSYEKLISLKGIGEYTAAAISSFSSNEAKAVLDGNVFRLLSRYFGIDTPINSPAGKKQFSKLANEVMNQEKPGLYNQAVMEFGSLQCRPKKPLCETCPLQAGCFAFRNNQIEELPVKIKKKKSRDRYFTYLLIRDGEKILMNKRGAGDIWQNLYELPLIETINYITPEKLLDTPGFLTTYGKPEEIKFLSGPVKHLLSHQNIYAQFVELKFSETIPQKQGWFYIGADELENLAQPKLIFTFFKNFFKLS